MMLRNRTKNRKEQKEKEAWGSTVRDPKTGISITFCKQFQINPKFHAEDEMSYKHVNSEDEIGQ